MITILLLFFKKLLFSFLFYLVRFLFVCFLSLLDLIITLRSQLENMKHFEWLEVSVLVNLWEQTHTSLAAAFCFRENKLPQHLLLSLILTTEVAEWVSRQLQLESSSVFQEPTLSLLCPWQGRLSRLPGTTTFLSSVFPGGVTDLL